MRRSRWPRTLVVLLLVASVVALVGVGSALAQPPERVKVLIGFTQQPGPPEQALVRRAGGTIKYTYHLVPAIAATVPETAIQGLRRNPNVTHLELDGEVYAVDAELDNAWGVKHIGAGTVHDSGNKGAGIKVAIIDSGIDYTHLDLDDNYADGYDFVNSDANPMDDYGHGTHVAGTVAAEDNDVGVVGVAPEAKLYALKVLDASGRGYVSDIIAGIQWAVDNEIQVINMSLGGGPSSDEEVACQAAYDAGVLVVAAAGNSGNPPGRGDNVIYPAAYDTVIAVAATEKDDTRARFSSTGPDLELSAPGVDVNSTWLDGGYHEGSGTSMASPHVAGTAALVLAANPGWSNEQVRTQLQTTADDLGATGRDAWYGFGLVDAYEAAAPSQVATGTIAGTVTESDGVTAISGASVVVEGTSLSTTTDAYGVYSIGNVPEGTYDVTVSAGGFVSETQTGVTVSADTTTEVTFALAATPRGTIAGTVTNADGGAAISGATVSVDTGQSATTAGDGTYTIIDVPTGDRSVTASADGFESETKTATASEGQTTTVDFALSPVTTADTVSVSAITYATQGGGDGKKHLNVTIALVDDAENPVSGASVSIDLYRDGALYTSATGTTETDGTVTFKVPNAPSDCYTTTVTNVTADGLTWVEGAPDDGYCK